MSLNTIYWIVAAPYILMIGIALVVMAFGAALVLLDTLFITPANKLPESTRNILIGALCALAVLHGLGVVHFA